jgi:hypothetical protein
MTPSERRAAERLHRSSNRLCKWRKVLAGWVLGTRPDDDAAAAGMRDLQEVRLLLRAEVSAITNVLIDRGICTAEELTLRVADECDLLNEAMAARFPGIRATDEGLLIDPVKAAETMRRLGFPP